MGRRGRESLKRVEECESTKTSLFCYRLRKTRDVWLQARICHSRKARSMRGRNLLSSYGEGNAALLSPGLPVRGWVRGAVVRRPEALGLKLKRVPQVWYRAEIGKFFCGKTRVVGGCCGWKVSRGLFEHEPCRWLVSGIGPDGQGKWSRQNGQEQILEA
jgi:hypothetical protein